MSYTVSPAALAASAAKYRTQLLIMAVLGLDHSLKHMTLRTGIRNTETVGEMSGTVELEPYKGTIPTEDALAIVGRTLTTYLGQTVKLADPNALVSSIYGSGITSGKGLENHEINKAVIALIMNKISKGLNSSLFSASRNAVGTTTATLFDGFDKIVADEITGGGIAAGKGNYQAITGAITASDAVDKLKALYRAASDELQATQTKMFIPFATYNAYSDDYQATVGAAPYNKEFNKTFLEGSNNMCELVPLIGKAGSIQIQLTTKANTLVGTYLQGDYEKIEVRRGDNPFKLQFITTMFFGTQFESLSKEVFMNGKVIVA